MLGSGAQKNPTTGDENACRTDEQRNRTENSPESGGAEMKKTQFRIELKFNCVIDVGGNVGEACAALLSNCCKGRRASQE